MNTRRKYDDDSFVAYVSITAATEALTTRLPIEMIVAALLTRATQLLEEFDELEQWELIKSELLDVRDEFEKRAEPFWSNEVDRDIVAENYDRRYA